ncbi:MAG: hypothetical protein KF850_08555 [Labilithrix sp.]|nr:hypothetical protein [Labilithrix sp.]MBX3212069.1 hypothetical protein [Labilithrix sp.]
MSRVRKCFKRLREVLPALFVLVASCKKASPSAAQPDAAVAVVDAGPIVEAGAVTMKRDAGARRPVDLGLRIVRLSVSSRVDNETESPMRISDRDTETAWSSKTGELEGAWVEMHVSGSRSIKSLLMTVGMTKKPESPDDPDLFLANPRIEQIALSWTSIVALGPGNEKRGETAVVVERFKLDVASRDLQPVVLPTPLQPPGILRMTVKKVRMGTKPAWREVSISEIALRDELDDIEVPNEYGVGPIDPALAYARMGKGKPRGVLGIVPEEQPPLGCHAYMPRVPRVYCVLGHVIGGSWRSSEAALVSIDPTRSTTIAALGDTAAPSSDIGEYVIPYGDWLRVERELEGEGRTLPKNGKRIPWNGSIEVSGVTFRQRETKNTEPTPDAPDAPDMNGVVEVQWPGEPTFKTILKDSSQVARAPMTATLIQLGSWWLVERRLGLNGEGLYGEGADAVLCDLSAKRCTE